MRLVVLIVSVLFGVAATIAAEAGAEERTVTPICQIVHDPERFDDQEVVVRGVFFSDYHHGSVLIEPNCRWGVSPSSESGVGQDILNAALCSEAGGLVEVTARGRVEAHPGEVPSMRFHVTEYLDARGVPFDPTWEDRWGALQQESRENWRGRRLRICMMAGYVDPNTLQRIEPATSQ